MAAIHSTYAPITGTLGPDAQNGKKSMNAETKPDPDVIVLRRVLAAAKSKKSRPKWLIQNWIDGRHDDTIYFQAGLAEMKECRKEGLIG